MRQTEHISFLMGKHYHGQTPCIPPLAMAELMVRLENKRNLGEETLRSPRPCNPVAQWLSALRDFFK